MKFFLIFSGPGAPSQIYGVYNKWADANKDWQEIYQGSGYYRIGRADWPGYGLLPAVPGMIERCESVSVNEEELRIDTYTVGSTVNVTNNAVRITHIPTGFVVSESEHKSIHKNKAKALENLRIILNRHKWDFLGVD